jgi:hypothetical protein
MSILVRAIQPTATRRRDPFSASLKWIAGRLDMGTWSYVSNLRSTRLAEQSHCDDHRAPAARGSPGACPPNPGALAERLWQPNNRARSAR